VFPARYELNSYIVFRKRLVSKRLNSNYGGKFVSPMHPTHFTPQKHYYFYVSGTHFCYRLSTPQELVRLEGLGKFRNSPHRESNPRPSGL
jgi:hypothetical protein